jgi:hypothetical protein
VNRAAQRLGPAQRRRAGPGVPGEYAEQLPGRQVGGQVELGPRRDLVPEQRRLLVRVTGAADRAEQRGVVDVAPGGLVQAGPFGQPGGEQARAQAMLERHAGRQIRGQADRGDQRGQLNAVTRALHPPDATAGQPPAAGRGSGPARSG